MIFMHLLILISNEWHNRYRLKYSKNIKNMRKKYIYMKNFVYKEIKSMWQKVCKLKIKKQ